MASGLDLTTAEKALAWAKRSEAQAGHEVTYEVRRDNWYVVSGLDGSTIFYEKGIVSSGVLVHARLEYPQSLKKEMGPVVKRVTGSLHPGAAMGSYDLSTITEACVVLTPFSYGGLDEGSMIEDCEARIVGAEATLSEEGMGEAKTDRIQLGGKCPAEAGKDVRLLMGGCYIGHTRWHRRDIVCSAKKVLGDCSK